MLKHVHTNFSSSGAKTKKYFKVNVILEKDQINVRKLTRWLTIIFQLFLSRNLYIKPITVNDLVYINSIFSKVSREITLLLIQFGTCKVKIYFPSSFSHSSQFGRKLERKETLKQHGLTIEIWFLWEVNALVSAKAFFHKCNA